MFICISNYLSGQGKEQTFNYFYRIYFRDKGNKSISDFDVTGLLSPRALLRRQRNGIPVPDYRDLPVNKEYLDEISSLGLTFHCTSRWMNTALFKTVTPAEISNLLALPFISEVKTVRTTIEKKSQSDKLSFTVYQSGLSVYNNPVDQLNGLLIHDSGFTGGGILIAVMDGGFYNAEKVSSLASLRGRNGITATYDFVAKNKNVYDYHNHGTAVLSVLAGIISGSIEGSAPGSDFLLLRTEDDESEFPVEEDFWAAGAEFADSSGADIISSSIGYFNFDDPSMNYKYSDMDGNRTFVTKAADIAASKGIIVVSSAGNERGNDWKSISAPSDGDSVLAVGAIDVDKTISSFSSSGPSFDNRIKPDVVAQGVGVPVQMNTEIVGSANGTSFSCPVISGMCACIMQAVPDATSNEILSAILSASDRFLHPDSLYGYGIPDMTEALSNLQKKYILTTGKGIVAGPNPLRNILTIYFNDSPGWLRIEILNISGALILKRNYRNYVSRSIVLDDFQNLADGLYFIRLYTANGTYVHKVIKVGNR
jgi:subtilisin family serine protease